MFLLASCVRVWMKIGGHQADAFPDPPIQPKTLDVHKKIQQQWKIHSKQPPEYLLPELFFDLLNPVKALHRHLHSVNPAGPPGTDGRTDTNSIEQPYFTLLFCMFA